MHATSMRDHLTMVELLPDFILGTLDDASSRRVTRHLESCATCRSEYANALQVLGLLADVAPPAPPLRDVIMQRAEAMAPPASISGVSTWPEGSKRPPWSVIPERMRGPDTPFGRPVPRGALVACSAAVLLFAAVLGWSAEQRAVQTPDDRIQALVDDPNSAIPLDDSDLPVAATGVVFADPHGREVYLMANGLPVLPEDQRYQVWLFTTEDELVSAGLLAVGEDGTVRELLQTPDPFADYVGVALTAEPKSGSEFPTSDLVLGGSFPAPNAAPPKPPDLADLDSVDA